LYTCFSVPFSGIFFVLSHFPPAFLHSSPNKGRPFYSVFLLVASTLPLSWASHIITPTLTTAASALAATMATLSMGL